MIRRRLDIARHGVKKVIAIQAGVVISLSVAAIFLYNWWLAFSVLIGGLISIVPSVYFSWRALASSAKVNQSGQLVIRFFKAEAIKIALTAILFFVAATWLMVDFRSLLVGYIGSYLAFGVAPWLIDNNNGE